MRLTSILLFLSCVANANPMNQDRTGEAVQSFVNACRHDRGLEACQKIEEAAENVAKDIEEFLTENGVKDSAAVTAGIAKVAIDGGVRVSTGEVKIFRANDSTIEVSNERVYINIRWELD